MSILEVKNLRVALGENVALDNISFALEKGDELAIIGPNGSGKTTLLKAILGVIPYSGNVGRADNIKIGYVPQKLDLERDLPISVREFLGLSEIAEDSREHYSPEAALALVNLAPEFLKKRLGELSAGELQRVMIAWAVIGKPDLLLFDEPTASVDVAGQDTVYEMLHRLRDTSGMTLLLISHDLTIVYKYANKVLCLNHTQTCFGAPREVLSAEALNELYGGGKIYEHTH
jgi:zinc transport system ATP-binding protein